MDIIGLFGGTFNPIHLGHLALAHNVLQMLDCHHIRFIPAAIPPHKALPGVSAEQRAEMVALAIASEPRFMLDRCELARRGASYTIDTLQLQRQRFPQSSLVLLMGQDSYQQLPTWHRWESLLTLAHLLVIRRADSNSAFTLHAEHAGSLVATDAVATQFAASSHGKLCYLTLTPPAINSTSIRNKLGLGDDSVMADLPAAIWPYLQQHQLYRRSASF